MRILGIDPGINSTGYGILETDGTLHTAVRYGAIKTQMRLPFHQRLHKIYKGLMDVLAHEEAQVMAIEEVFYAANIQSALKLGQARGVALLVGAQKGLAVFEYSPLEIKNAIVGYGRAEKAQVQAMVQFLLRLPEIPSPNDAADALAVAICHANRLKSHEGRI
jgi:crossover junction endodeoxyribonuclease RuvC